MTLWAAAKIALSEWSRHRTGRLGAALAYYSVFSLGPLLLIIVSVAGFFFGEAAARGELMQQVGEYLGPSGSSAVESMIAGASSSETGRLAAIWGIALVLVSALVIVVQMKDALNTIWNVADPENATVAYYIRTYGTALLAVMVLGLLLAASLLLTAVVSALSGAVNLPSGDYLEVVDFLLTLIILAGVFALLYKWLPDTEITWTDVWPGAIAAAFLFSLGKLVIGWYIGSQGLESTYGAAASIVALLVWVYYSAQIVLFGAELTHAYAHVAGSRAPEPATAPSRHTASYT